MFLIRSTAKNEFLEKLKILFLEEKTRKGGLTWRVAVFVLVDNINLMSIFAGTIMVFGSFNVISSASHPR